MVKLKQSQIAEFVVTDSQKDTARELSAIYLETHLPRIRARFNKIMQEQKMVVVIGKKPYVHEYRAAGDKMVRYIGGKTYDTFKKTLTAPQIEELKEFDAKLTAHEFELFNLIYGGLESAFLWGVFNALKESALFVKTTRQKQKVNYEQRFSELIGDVIDYLNARAGTSYKASTQIYIQLIGERAAEGYTLQDFQRVVDRQVLCWLHDPNMVQYLRPTTLFNRTKFTEYAHGTDVSGQNRNTANFQTGFDQGFSGGEVANKNVGRGTRQNNALERLQGLKRP